jgi:hypothetical protein
MTVAPDQFVQLVAAQIWAAEDVAEQLFLETSDFDPDLPTEAFGRRYDEALTGVVAGVDEVNVETGLPADLAAKVRDLIVNAFTRRWTDLVHRASGGGSA